MEPYISFVVASRNDNHGEDMLRRMQLFVNGLLHQTRKFKLQAELIFVEWNPPKNKPLLHEVLPKPTANDVLTIRYIIVPEEIHHKYKTSDVIPLYQMIAKNVGIRRAKGQFILCTNIDLLFSDDLFKILSSHQLSAQCFYRANRCDIPATIEPGWSFDRQMDYAKQHIMRRFGMQYYYKNLADALPVFYKYPLLATVIDNLTGIKRRLFNKGNLEHIVRQLDVQACGDFTMMSKGAWLDIQGYLELDMYSIHIDSLGIYAAAALGYQQVVFPPDACTYHIDHKNGWESMTPVEKIKFVEQRPGLGYDIMYDTSRYLIKNKLRYNLNKPDWGYEGYDFKEIDY